MSGTWKDTKIRANDVQVGDYIYTARTYREVRAVQYGNPKPGWVRIVVTEMGAYQSDFGVEIIHMPADDAILRCSLSGDEPRAQWLQIPADVKDALPTVLVMAMKAVGMKSGLERGDSNGQRTGFHVSDELLERVAQQRQTRAAIALAGLWIATVCGDELTL